MVKPDKPDKPGKPKPPKGPLMATRFYFNVTKAADLALSRPLNGFWERNATPLQTTRKLTTTRYGGAVIGPTDTVGTGTNPNDQLWFQGLSAPLAAQTISGTLTGVMVVRESNNSANLTTKVRIYVVNKSGTVVATLYDGSGGSSEWNSPSANTRDFWSIGSASISSYSCSGGDRIVVEIGVRVASTRTADTAYMYLGDQSATTDLPTGDASSNNQTLSPWIEFSGNLTFGYTETGSFTANSIFQKTQSASFTADAYIASGTQEQTGSFTANSVLQRLGVSGSFTADAMKMIPRSGTVTADACFSYLRTSSFTADAIISVTPTIIEDDPFDDPATEAGTWGTRWTMITGVEGSTAELGRNPTVGAFVYDDSNTVLDSERGGYINKRTYLKKSMIARAKIAQTDAPTVFDSRFAVYLRHSGETNGLGYYTATYVAVELVLLASGYMQLQIRSNYNSVLLNVDLTSLGTWADGDEFYIKGWVKGSRVKGKVWRIGDPEPRWQINRNDLGIQTGAGYIGMAANTDTSWKPVEWHVRQATAINLEYSLDLDAVILAATPGSFTADSVVKATRTPTFTADAVISAGEVLKSFTADAITRVGRTGSFTADAAMAMVRTSTLTADARILAPRSGSFSADALIVIPRSGSLSSNAVIQETQSGSLTAASILTRTDPHSFTADALMRIERSATIGAGAWLQRVQTGQLIAAAVLHRNQIAQVTAQAVVRDTRTDGFTASAVMLSTRTQTLPASAITKRSDVQSITGDAVFTRSVAASLSANAVIVIRTTEQLGQTLAVVELTHQLAVDALDHAVSTSMMVFAIRTTYERSFTANAVIVGV